MSRLPTWVKGHPSPRWFPDVAGLGTLSFLAGILLLFSGVEVQAVHTEDMKDPRRGFPKRSSSRPSPASPSSPSARSR